MDFRKLSTLDKFLLIYGKSLDQLIDSCEVKTQKNVYIAQKGLLNSVANFVKHIDSMTDDEVLIELEAFKDNKILSNYISQLTFIEGSEYNA